MSATVKNSKAILARLGDLMGDRGAGQLLVHSTDATGTVPAGAIATPLAGEDLDEEAAVIVDENPATSDCSWPVTDAGTAVPVTPLLGGTVGDRPEGTVYRWQPTLDGIEEMSQPASGQAVSGGVDSTEPGAPRQIRAYKQVSRADMQELFAAQAGRFPCILLAWEATQPLDGPLASEPGPRQARMGRVLMQYRNAWAAFLITSRMDGESLRRDESDLLRDMVTAQLFGAQKALGLRVSMEPGANIVDARVFRVSPSSYVDLVRFRTTYTEQMKRKAKTAYPDWKKTRVRQQTEEQDDEPPINLPDATIDMTPES